MQPKHYCVVSGVGKSKYPLVAFDEALRAAGVGDYNLVKVSSILPPACIEETEIDAPKGSILFTAYGMAVASPGEVKESAVACAVPVDSDLNGVIFETSTDGAGAHETVVEMCRAGMENRGRDFKVIKSASATAVGEDGIFVSCFAGIAMW